MYFHIIHCDCITSHLTAEIVYISLLFIAFYIDQLDNNQELHISTIFIYIYDKTHKESFIRFILFPVRH